MPGAYAYLSKRGLKERAMSALLATGLLAATALCPLRAQSTRQAQNAQDSRAPLSLNTSAVSPNRFVAVHGRKALLDGYATGGLEMWAYPIEVLDGYQIAFREPGTTSAISGPSILRRIIYRPECVTRIYIGPDFIVRERLFVPLDHSAAILTYQVTGVSSLQIIVHFHPVLNLMWPAAIGGQDMSWNAQARGYILSEPTHRFWAVIGSTAIVAHDPVYNRPHSSSDAGPGFTIVAKSDAPAGNAAVVIAAGAGDVAATDGKVAALTASRESLLTQAAEHYQTLLHTAIDVETPDAALNQELRWSQVALDQAWVCNPQLGCGLVAGYGPSRGARRPQYAWFFAGDAMTAVDALLSEGQYTRARDALDFIARYQDPKTGMIWHEMSQSAGLIDWVHGYPYMFVHVDISFQYLQTVEHYVAASGNAEFLSDHWNSIAAAYRYCGSLIDASGLPIIPVGKEGGDEQDRMQDELTLSAAWVAASQAYSQMAAWMGKPAESAAAHAASERARRASAAHYWNTQANFWLDGHTAHGEPIFHRSSNGNVALRDRIFSPSQQNAALDALAAATFQTDWGTRSVPTDSVAYQPGSYATGSVWAVNTANVARAFWSAGRASTANQIWSSLEIWPRMNALGHMDEVLGGNAFYEQMESVPEQTWSSAGFLQAAVQGLLGITVDSKNRSLTFIPQPPAEWKFLTVRNVRIGNSVATLAWGRTSDGEQSTITNAGPPFTLNDTVALPSGATLQSIEVNGKPVHADRTAQSPSVHLSIPRGTTTVRVRIAGGIAVVVPPQRPRLGDTSRGVKLIRERFSGNDYALTVDASSRYGATLVLLTPWRVVGVDGAQWKPEGDAGYRLTIPPDAAETAYRRVVIHVHVKTK
jgi:hypothetical protein